MATIPWEFDSQPLGCLLVIIQHAAQPLVALDRFPSIRVRFVLHDEAVAQATRLDANQINIDHAYDRLDPDSTQGLLVFGVGKLTEAASILDELAAENV
jgi:hypothetical protein